MDAALTRDTLGRLLDEENAALGEFASLLDKEYGALRGRDIDALESLADARQASVIKLLKIEEERRSLCSMLGYDTDLAGLAKLLAWCDPARSLAKALRRMRHPRARLPRSQQSQRRPGRCADQACRGTAGRHDRRVRRTPRLRPARPVKSVRQLRRQGSLRGSVNSLLRASLETRLRRVFFRLRFFLALTTYVPRGAPGLGSLT